MTHNATIIDGVLGGSVTKGQLLKYASGGWVPCDTAGEHSDGIAFADGASGDTIAIQVGQICIYKVGGSDVADGAQITTTTGGLGITATSGQYVRLKALGAASSGAFGRALWFDGYVFDGT
jgi:hypothetical protein